MIAASPKLTPWFCHGCGRMEDEAGQVCPDCHSRRQHVSRYEWFLADALEDQLKACGLSYSITEQFPLHDSRGFTWYFDLRVSVCGKRLLTDLIEINGASHLRPSSRDQDKYAAWWHWRIEQDGAAGEFWIVANQECRKAVVGLTASRIVASILRRAL